jgi:aspartate beta-hydroxylase/beta-hydroxylase
MIKRIAYFFLRLANIVFSFSPGWRSRPAVREVASTCPELARLEEQFLNIKAEYLSVRSSLSSVPRYHEVDKLQMRISRSDNRAENWRVFFFEAMGLRAHKNRSLCPRTAALVDSIPGVFQACFSILEGGKSIPSHRSPYWGYLRYHLGIEVPAQNPPRMRVRDTWVEWHEGQGFIFDDSLEHEVINPSSQVRAVLIVDVPRPMAPVGRTVNRFMIFFLRRAYARRLIKKAEAFD